MSDAETYYARGVYALELAEAQPHPSPSRTERLLEARAYFDAANTCLRFRWSRPPEFKVPTFECPTEGCKRLDPHPVGECRSEP